MIDESKYPEYREKVYNFIKSEIVPKYPDIESCTMHVLPKELIANVEFIFNLNHILSKEELSRLQWDVEHELYAFVKSLNINGPYMTRVILIFL